MYLLAPNQVIEKYPYSIGELRRDNPSVSFPANPSLEVLSEWNVFPVEKTAQPSTDWTKNVAEDAPSLKDGVWVQTWNVEEASQEELQQRTDSEGSIVRGTRSRMLSDSDWTQLDDTPITNAKKLEWAAYRQALRDVPSQPGFPWEVTWPVEPA